MFVKYLDCEDYADIHNPDKEIENPTWNEIQKAILGLNGNTRSTVTIARDREDGYMGIGGGENGLYICFICSYLTGEEDWELCDPSKSTEQTVEMMTGQMTKKSLRSCIDLNSVLKAAETYANFGKRDRSLCWEML
jgi:hypothetical protein